MGQQVQRCLNPSSFTSVINHYHKEHVRYGYALFFVLKTEFYDRLQYLVALFISHSSPPSMWGGD
jgi:hypothetical protein